MQTAPLRRFVAFIIPVRVQNYNRCAPIFTPRKCCGAQFGQCAGFGAVHYSKLPKSQQQRLVRPERPGQGVGGAQSFPACPDIARRGTLRRNVQLHA